MEPRTKAKVLN